MRMVRWCIRLTRLTLVFEVIRHHLVQVPTKSQRKKFLERLILVICMCTILRCGTSMADKCTALRCTSTRSFLWAGHRMAVCSPWDPSTPCDFATMLGWGLVVEFSLIIVIGREHSEESLSRGPLLSRSPRREVLSSNRKIWNLKGPKLDSSPTILHSQNKSHRWLSLRIVKENRVWPLFRLQAFSFL